MAAVAFQMLLCAAILESLNCWQRHCQCRMVSSIPGQRRQVGESAMPHFARLVMVGNLPAHTWIAVLVCLRPASLHSRKRVVALLRALYRAVVIVLRAACMCLSSSVPGLIGHLYYCVPGVLVYNC
eukprot:3123728-Rhodomonas_salina.1